MQHQMNLLVQSYSFFREGIAGMTDLNMMLCPFIFKLPKRDMSELTLNDKSPIRINVTTSSQIQWVSILPHLHQFNVYLCCFFVGLSGRS